MTKTKVIGFYGVAQAGKSTAAHMAAEMLRNKGHKVAIRSFAGPLKEGLAEMGIHKDKTPDLYREAAQYMGTEICRSYDDNWWVNQMKHTVDTMGDDTIILIDDCRFANELDYLKSIDATLVFILAGPRFDEDNLMYLHASETIAVAHEKYFMFEDYGITRMPPKPQYTPDYIVPNYADIGNMMDELKDIILKIEVNDLD